MQENKILCYHEKVVVLHIIYDKFDNYKKEVFYESLGYFYFIHGRGNSLMHKKLFQNKYKLLHGTFWMKYCKFEKFDIQNFYGYCEYILRKT